METYPGPPAKSPETVRIAVCFRSWVAAAAETRAGESDRRAMTFVLVDRTETSEWNPRRCLLTHMYQQDSAFRKHLLHLRDRLLAATAHRAFRDFVGICATAIRDMDRFQIKTLSYQGAVAIRTSNGWNFTDPGNFVYTLWWLLMGRACRHMLKHRTESDVHETCRAFGSIQKELLCRWPRRKDSPQLCETIGDIIECALAASYLDGTRYWHLQEELAPTIVKVREFVHFLDHHARRERMGVDGSFFASMSSRCECASRLAVAMFNAMHVQKYGVDMTVPRAAGFIALSRELMLLYPHE